VKNPIALSFCFAGQFSVPVVATCQAVHSKGIPREMLQQHFIGWTLLPSSNQRCQSTEWNVAEISCLYLLV